MTIDNLGAGGYRRARVRQPKNVPGWKPLLGEDVGVEGEYLPPDGIGAGVPRRPGARRKAVVSQGMRKGVRRAAKTSVKASTMNPKVRAGMYLLDAAEKNPRAKRKVRRIVVRAKAGDPKAISAVQTLRVAKVAQQQERKKKRRRLFGRRRQETATNVVPTDSPVLPTGEVAVPRGIFSFWDKGSG